MKKIIATLALLAQTCTPAISGAIPQPGDIYLISRDRYGIFLGSHKLFLEVSDGLAKVSYCNREYFVRSQSVAWTQLESERGNSVRIEFNFGRGWRPICENPENQVSLQDIGINMTAEEVLASTEDSSSPQNRISAIRKIFQAKGSETSNSSFHTR